MSGHQRHPEPFTTDIDQHDQPYLPVRVLDANGKEIVGILQDDALVGMADDCGFNSRAYELGRLFAAAPDLLAACKKCVYEAVTVECDAAPEMVEMPREVVDGMRAAIAKAEGGAA